MNLSKFASRNAISNCMGRALSILLMLLLPNVSLAAATFIQQSPEAGQITTFGSTTANGNTIICYGSGSGNSGPISDDASGGSNVYTEAFFQTGWACSVLIYYSINAKPAKVVTMPDGSFTEFACSEWSGITGLDAAVGSAAATNTVSIGPVIASQANDLAIIKTCSYSGTSTPSGYTYLVDGPGYGDEADYQIVSSAGSFSGTVQASGNPNVSVMALFTTGCTAGTLRYNVALNTTTYCNGTQFIGVSHATVGSCTVTDSGKIHYTGGVGGIFEFCNGANWVSMKGSSTTGTTCNSTTNLGMIGWDNSLKIEKYCDGTGWYDVSGSTSFDSLSVQVQTLSTQVCSQITITSLTQGVVANPRSIDIQTTGSITGPGALYTDSDCTAAGNTATLYGYTNSTNLYVKPTGAGAITITVAGDNNYLSGSVTATAVTVSPFTWRGGGGNVNWSTPGNWLGGAAPGINDVAIFDSTCLSNCSPTIDVGIEIGGLEMLTGYTGTITQGVGNQIDIDNTQGWLQQAGTFSGGNADINLWSGSFIVSGGSFKSTSGMLYNNTWAPTFTIAPSVTWNANGGSVSINNYALNVGTGNPVFNNLELVTASGFAIVSSGAGGPVVNGTLTLNNPNQNGMTGGTITAKGNVTVINSGDVGSMTGDARTATTIKVAGSTSQTIDASAVTGAAGLPSLTIASTGGTVSLVGTLRIFGNYTYTSGTISSGTSTLAITCNSNYYNPTAYEQVVNFGTPTYNSITFSSYGPSGCFISSVGNTHAATITFDASTGPMELDLTSGKTMSSTGAFTMTGGTNGATLTKNGATLTYGSLVTSGTTTINP